MLFAFGNVVVHSSITFDVMHPFMCVLFCSFFLMCWWVDEFKEFFSKHGKVVEHEIIRDHVTKRSRGFGFIVFDNEQVVDNLLADGNMIDMMGTQVSIVQLLNLLGHSSVTFTLGLQFFTIVILH